MHQTIFLVPMENVLTWLSSGNSVTAIVLKNVAAAAAILYIAFRSTQLKHPRAAITVAAAVGIVLLIYINNIDILTVFGTGPS